MLPLKVWFDAAQKGICLLKILLTVVIETGDTAADVVKVITCNTWFDHQHMTTKHNLML